MPPNPKKIHNPNQSSMYPSVKKIGKQASVNVARNQRNMATAIAMSPRVVDFITVYALIVAS